jgi:hypothetical protein
MVSDEKAHGLGFKIAQCALPKDMISYNVSNGQHWANKTKSWKQARDWAIWFRCSEGLGFEQKQGKNRRLIKITRILSGRMRLFEKVNLYAGAKPVEDALVHLGWLIDDDEKHEDVLVEQVRVSVAPGWMQKAVRERKAKVAVEIFDLDEPIKNAKT